VFDLHNKNSTKLTLPTNFAKKLYLLLKAWYNVLSLFNLLFAKGSAPQFTDI